MPYPIPENVGDVTGWRWYLVPIPDDDVFVSVAWGIFSELTFPWSWGLEGRVPDSDVAAQKWSAAVYEALRVRDMGFPDDVLTHIDEIEALLEALQSVSSEAACCDDDFAVDQMTDPGGIIQPVPDEPGGEIIVGEGDPPGGVEDWPTYDVRLCEAAEKFVDGLAGYFGALQAISVLTNIGLAGAIAFLLPVMAGVGIVGASVAGALGLFTSLTFLDDLRSLLGLGLAFEDQIGEMNDTDVKQELKCAIVLSGTVDAAVSAFEAAALVNAPESASYLGWLPLRFMLGRVFNMESDAAGGYGSGCDCEFTADFVATWPSFSTNITPFSCTGGSDASCGAPPTTFKMNPNASAPCTGTAGVYFTLGQIIAQDGGSLPGGHDTALIKRIEATYTLGSASVLAPYFRVDGNAGAVDHNMADGPGVHTDIWDANEIKSFAGGLSSAVWVRIPAAGSNDVNNQLCLSELKIYMDTYQV